MWTRIRILFGRLLLHRLFQQLLSLLPLLSPPRLGLLPPHLPLPLLTIRRKPKTTTPTLKPTTTIPKPIAKDNPSTPLSRDSNVLCRGDTCVAIATEETNTNTTYVRNSTNPSNEIEVNLPPDTEYQNDFVEQNEIPNSSKHKAAEENGSSGLAIGLSLTFIFLAIIVGVGVFLIWRYKFREQPKGKGKGKAKSKGKGKKKPTQILRDNLNKINLTKITSLHKK